MNHSESSPECGMVGGRSRTGLRVWRAFNTMCAYRADALLFEIKRNIQVCVFDHEPLLAWLDRWAAIYKMGCNLQRELEMNLT